MALRFNSDRSLFDTYPTALKDVGVEPQDVVPTMLARDLAAEGRLNEAISLCAYMLGRREAIAWGCRSLRGLKGADRNATTPALQAAELWVDDSTALRQDAAREVGAAGDDNEPTTGMARATGWAGGSFAPTVPFPIPPHLTAVGVRIGLIIALSRLKGAERVERGRACVEDAIRTAEGGRQP